MLHHFSLLKVEVRRESRAELLARIRRDARGEGRSIQEPTRRHGVGQPTNPIGAGAATPTRPETTGADRAPQLWCSTVRDYIRRRCQESNAEAGRLPQVFIPQDHVPGAEAEIDFGELLAVLAGVTMPW